MAKNVDIARALKDSTYFNGLTNEEKEMVRKASPVGGSNLSDKDLDSVSGGLGGGDRAESTTTTTELTQCTCGSTGPTQPQDGTTAADGCTCSC